ncbi:MULTISPECIES: DUF2793 domain-containing protein [Rhodomicrobium]|uniref:DUF2793 domain-containing protein n=1 Tax=Rhodomicrobium TaxID=1068 RepID=UPI000B4A930E|nr:MULTISPECIES: DUF2793 domain-containing protein [Rhodomicrobium]
MPPSTHLALPFIEAAQAQKHVTHNAALLALDAIVMLSVLDRDLAAPPGSPADGDRYLIAASATGAWSGKDGKIAARQDGAWSFHAPREGWLLWIADEDIVLAFDGAAWTGAATQNAARLGVNTTADATNKLSVASGAVLFNHIGSGVQVKLNKNAAGDTASFLFQTAFSGRAEIGCLGNDDFSFKTSADGSTFDIGLTLVAAANGAPRLPSFTVATLPSAATAGTGAFVFVSDATGGAVPAFSDGTDWRRSDTSAVVS